MSKILLLTKEKPVLIVIVFLFLSTGCNNYKEHTILEIDIETSIESLTEIKCSDFVKSFEYIPLETSDSCLINKWPTIQITGSDLVAQTFRDCFIFDSKTGNFKYRIGKRGRGPGEYNNTMRLVDLINKTVFFQKSGGQILEYSLQNKLLRKIQIPAYDASFESPSMPTGFSIFKNWIICYFGNMNGKEEKLLMAINKDTSQPGFIVPNPNIYENAKQSFSTGEAFFNTYKNSLFFKEIYNDTIYQLKDEKLIPHVVLFTGKKRFSYKMKFEGGYSRMDYLHSLSFFESKNFFGFRYFLNRKQYFGVYSKEENKLKLTDLEEDLPNDIDGFIGFKPKQSLSDNKLICIVDAYKIVQWFNDNPEKAAKLPPHLQKLKNIKETDNPIVMIATLKE